MNNLTKYLTKNFIATSSKTLVVSLTTLFLLPLIINRLGLHLYGIVSLTLLFSSVSSLVDLGLSKAVILLSGKNKHFENKVISAALVINIIIISCLTIIFIVLQLLSVDLLGKNLDVTPSNKFIVLNISFLLLIFMLLNNLCRTVLEAKYKMHIVSITLAVYTPILYGTIFILSFFTKQIIIYTLTPLLLTFSMLVFNVIYIKLNTSVKIVAINYKDIIYVFKKSVAFLNIGLINSMVMPTMRYAFVLFVADVSLYAIFDLSFKIAMLANSFVLALSTPMFAVFSTKIKENSTSMIQIAYKIFYVSLAIYIGINLGYYFFGNYFLTLLHLNTENLTLLYNITFILIISLGSVALVEIFYRYFLGNNQLVKAFLLKLIVPLLGIFLFFLFYEVLPIYRFIYSYSISLIISALAIAINFLISHKKPIKT